MDKKATDTFAFDLENRLDDFFSDALPPQEDASADAPQGSDADLPLKDLKSTILAIDWEITDDALEAFIRQVDGLEERFAGEKAVRTLLKLLKSLGKYTRSHKSKAHPDTIKRIMSVYSTLEECVTDEALRADTKEKMVLEEVRQFQRLKSMIVDAKPPYPARDRRESTPSGEASGMDAVIQAIHDLKASMGAELAAIRAELKKLHKK